MKIKELMTMIEEANKLRRLVEEKEYSVNLVTPKRTLGSASTYEEFIKIMKGMELYTNTLGIAILSADFVKDTARRFLTIVDDESQDKKFLVTLLIE